LLTDQVLAALGKHGVTSESIRAVVFDFDVKPGVEKDMGDDGPRRDPRGGRLDDDHDVGEHRPPGRVAEGAAGPAGLTPAR